MSHLRLNCDLGESFGAWQKGDDAAVMPFIDQANIACGFHASDPVTMMQTVALAKQYQVSIGAHPSYPDLVGFGRRSMACSTAEIRALVTYQIGALAAVCRVHDSAVSYVKPHGALYNDMIADSEVFQAVCAAVAAYDADLPLMVMATEANDKWRALAKPYGLTLWFEGFADRAYDDNGRLRARRQAGAVYQHRADILTQAERFAQRQPIVSYQGRELSIEIDSLCVHGDNAESLATVKAIRQRLQQLTTS
ncbi:5-oxoprolinase subunit PxpA [Idiomarina xiamenensis]|uniref:LamB/YcsF family protein n=1 Tax=Idiomarina xiamenensis 10-D-4 TaxID=740709 RepID=K2KWI5_9GAMM|nr:5-oxoprolinase subunit PxpA [Idiomarina xiamenensis]EKE86839.1 LamB/YcsF family protein [Idiomarina xiamenensis 10-D-4]